jgi:membrane fusion protein, multidrug efflux system
LRRLIASVALIALLAVAADYGYNWYQVGRFEISTDDAYVQSDISQLGAKVSGYIAAIPAAENASVKAGDVVVKLDDGDYKLAVAAAEAKIETQMAMVATITEQLNAQQSQITSALAQLDSAKAAELNASLTQNRASQLVKSNIGSVQSYDDATKLRATTRANVSVAEAGVEAAKAQIGILNAKSVEAQSGLKELQIALEKAKRDLSFTEIKAPYDGVVGNRAVQVGQFVAPGTRLMALVPTSQSFIVANFKETQLAEIHPGQKATITVDAFKGQTFEGKVVSISPASGAEFSLLPPENATGNFTKITQRLPVKISVPPELAAKLRAGLSVSVTVDSRDNGSTK